MACAIKKEQSIKLEAAQVYWGKEQCRVITTVADVASSLAGESFLLEIVNFESGTTKYLVFLDDGVVADPVPPTGATLLAVPYTPNATAAQIATALESVLSSLLNISVEIIDGNKVHIKNLWIGPVSDDFTNFSSFEVELALGIGGFLGRTSEGIEVTIETQSTVITSNQTGEISLDEIGQGQSANCTASFIELTKERLEAMIAGAVGGVYTPVGGSKLIGGGSSKLFQSLKELGGKLILHPQRLPLSDRSEDFIFWQSAPKPESINYSGTDVQALSVTFEAYLDDSKPAEINLFAIGDWTQLVE